MAHLYVCEFSNGFIKVGRSIDPAARIAQHADRVACVGVDLLRSAVFACISRDSYAEGELIRQCSGSAQEIRGNEWFAGLTFKPVCVWAEQCANLVEPIERLKKQTEYAGAPALHEAIGIAGGITSLAHKIGCNTKSQTIANWLKRGTPAKRCIDIERITGVPCEDLNPEFNWALLIEVLSAPGRSTAPDIERQEKAANPAALVIRDTGATHY